MSVNNKSQIGQDVFLDQYVFNRKTDGVFVEVGALDGFGASNTWFFEKDRNWSGLLIEPNPIEYRKMADHPRSRSKTENCAILNTENVLDFISIEGPCNVLSCILQFCPKEHLDRIDVEFENYKNCPKGHPNYSYKEIVKIQSYKLQTLLNKYDIKKIDLLSIDVEGAELEVLQSIDFDKTDISCLLVETDKNSEEKSQFLINKGYRILRNIQWDTVFVKN